jgi:hypothetical protein
MFVRIGSLVSLRPPLRGWGDGWDAVPGLRFACPGLFSAVPTGRGQLFERLSCLVRIVAGDSGFGVCGIPGPQKRGTGGTRRLSTVHRPLSTEKRSNVFRARLGSLLGAAVRGLWCPRSPKVRERGHPDGWDLPRTALRLSWASDLRPLWDEANGSNVFRAWLGSLPGTPVRGLWYPRSPKARDGGTRTTVHCSPSTVH